MILRYGTLALDQIGLKLKVVPYGKFGQALRIADGKKIFKCCLHFSVGF
jgi:hypothetical protein